MEVASIASHKGEDEGDLLADETLLTFSSFGLRESTDYVMVLRRNTATDIWGSVSCANVCVWDDRVRQVLFEVPERHIHRCFGSSARGLGYGTRPFAAAHF